MSYVSWGLSSTTRISIGCLKPRPIRTRNNRCSIIYKQLCSRNKSECGFDIWRLLLYYDDVIMGAMASQITSLTTVYSGLHQRKHQSSASLAFVRGIYRGPVNSPHKWPVTRKMFPFDDVIMSCESLR